MSEAVRRFAEMHRSPGCFVVPNPWDAGTARLLTQLGFRALATSSAAAAFALGRRDGVWAVERGEMLAHVAGIVAATPLPVSADLESGFGDLPEDVAETVAEAVAVGSAGGSIEDATGVADRPLYDLDLATARIRAARAAIDDLGSEFVLTARSETFLVGHDDPLAEGIRRVKAYAAAGADCVYVPGVATAAEIERLVGEAGAPVNVLAGIGAAPPSVERLAGLGVRRISLGSHLVRRALTAFVAAAREVAESGTFGFVGDSLGFDHFDRAFAADRDPA